MPPNDPYYNQPPVTVPANNLPSHRPKLRLVAGLIITIILLAAALAFGVWSYGQMRDYKNNSDQKVAAAVQQANAAQKQQLEAQFAEQAKSPYKTYTGPSIYGSVQITYPKSWSAYIIEDQTNTGLPVDAYFYPDFVPNVAGSSSFYLRFQIIGDSYSDVLGQYASAISQGNLSATPYKPPLVKTASVGVRLDGQLGSNTSGSMVIIPLRNVALEIWTDNPSATKDFNNVLSSLTFSP